MLDVEADAAWYERLLDLRRVRRVDLPQRTMIVLLHAATGLVIGLNQHHTFPGGHSTGVAPGWTASAPPWRPERSWTSGRNG